MKKFLKSCIQSLFLLIVFFSFTSQPIFSQENLQEQEQQSFENTLDSSYTVQENGDTLVQHTFRIKNLTPTYYISRHGLRISSPNISSVRVSDSSGEIPAEVTQTAAQTNIGITFPDELVGEGKTRQFTITYINPDLAQLNGQVLEIAIPKQAESNQYNDITVTLITPLNYGEPNRVSPTSNYAVSYRNNQILLTFSDLHGEGISALFGWQQVFDLNFRYFLENNDSQPVLLQVALPPDTPFQRMNYEQIDPKPREIKLDEDGNWIATFYMGGNTAQTVEVVASTVLTLERNGLVPIPQPQDFHTREQPFWDTSHRQIQEFAQQYTTPKEIYDFVTNNLQYAEFESIDQLERQGAVATLNNPELAVCQEFSDLFVALARANGIPARIATGYAYAENSVLRPLSLVDDVLHAWPEYWDAENAIWKPVDPTWENTTGGVDYFHQFDLNHIVLALNGKSSTLPYPAGSYKTAEHSEKTLDVSFGTVFPNQQANISAEIIPQRTSIPFLPGFYEMRLKNNTGAAWYNISFNLAADHSQIRIFGAENVPALLPYQSVTIPLFVYNTQGVWPATDQLAFSVAVNQETIVENHAEIQNAPYLFQYIARPYVLIGLGIGFVLLALGSGSVLILRRKR